MKNLDKLYETLDVLKKIKNDSEFLSLELYRQIKNDEIYEKMVKLIYLLSKKRGRVFCDYMTTTLERLKNGESPESIISDLENSSKIYIYKRDDSITNLKRIRKSFGMSQTELAEISGVNPRIIQYYEQGYKDINKAQAITLYKLAQILRCNIEDLLELEE